MEIVEDDFVDLDSNIDYRKILPLQQKRTIAFINNFLINTTDFLNKFAQSCESRMIDFEYKLNNVEASLLILEAQLSSIPNLGDDMIQVKDKKDAISDDLLEKLPVLPTEEVIKTVNQPAANEDQRFKRFFKMLQFGVPAPAVKIKMQIENIDPNILDTPTAVIPGFLSDSGIIGENNLSEDE